MPGQSPRRAAGRHRRPVSFTATLVRAAGWPVMAAAFLVAYLVTSSLSPLSVTVGPHPGTGSRPGAVVGAPAAATQPNRHVLALISRHDCWIDRAPAGAGEPGGVVVTLPGEDRPHYRGPEMADRALEQVFADVDHRLVVHAFCP